MEAAVSPCSAPSPALKGSAHRLISSLGLTRAKVEGRQRPSLTLDSEAGAVLSPSVLAGKVAHSQPAAEVV